MNAGAGWIAVGRVSRAHGIRGEVAVLPLSEVPGRFEPGARLFVGENGDRTLTVAAARPHQQRVLVRFAEVDDRDAASALTGAYLFVPQGSSPSLPEGSYWPHELEGCQVRTTSGRVLGEIREVVRTPANDVWVTALAGDGELLIPALRDVIASVDLAERLVVVHEIPGITTP
ncbi:MAG: 16S rRNA processing protein RimM [Actinobacteria bacterium]|nr:MAG: 16S rRNA processing protein RimM [Actinomycetota bacterium]